MTRRAPRVGLVLGGGGIAGYSFHAGALSALEESTGWDPRTAEIIVGTSAGSGIAAMVRGNVSCGELLDRIMSVTTDPEGMARLRQVSGRGQRLVGGAWFGPASMSLVARELMRGLRIRPLTVLAGALPAGRVDTMVVGEQASAIHHGQWPEKALWITAVSLRTGRLFVFGRDAMEVSVAKAVEASCAIPAFYQPVAIHGQRFVDGGMRSATNAGLLAEMDLDLVVILSPMSLDSVGFHSPLKSAIRMYPRIQVRSEIRTLEQAGIPTLLLEPDDAVSQAVGVNPMDPTKVVSVLVASSSSAAESLDHKDQISLEVLREAGRLLASPDDVPYPGW